MHVTLESVKQLYLTTKDGRTLAIAPQQVPTEASHLRRGGVFLYQELAPARPQVVSGLDPLDFGRLMTDPKNPIRLPKLLFARMRVGAEAGSIAAQSDLPYGNLPHLQNCAQEVLSKNKTGISIAFVARQISKRTDCKTTVATGAQASVTTRHR